MRSSALEKFSQHLPSQTLHIGNRVIVQDLHQQLANARPRKLYLDPGQLLPVLPHCLLVPGHADHGQEYPHRPTQAGKVGQVCLTMLDQPMDAVLYSNSVPAEIHLCLGCHLLQVWRIFRICLLVDCQESLAKQEFLSLEALLAASILPHRMQKPLPLLLVGRAHFWRLGVCKALSVDLLECGGIRLALHGGHDAIGRNGQKLEAACWQPSPESTALLKHLKTLYVLPTKKLKMLTS
mmetsp:Transcript_41758/g.97229  ORF Transcript_41758/g.97229 Transcript_41758/m.97229 type:complete len:237 (-) Transcript_41758:1056-1766(-)